MRPFNHIPSFLLATLLFLSLPAAAQDRLSFSLNRDMYTSSKKIDASRFTRARAADYLQYGFPRVQTAQERKTKANDRYIRNLITNKNKNGFIGNLLGLQRVRPARGGVPRF